MIRWKCGVTTKDQVSSQDLLERMQLDDLTKVLCTCRLGWHCHVERSDGRWKKVQKLNPTGGRGRGRPKETWTEVIDMDHLALVLTESNNLQHHHCHPGCFTSPMDSKEDRYAVIQEQGRIISNAI